MPRGHVSTAGDQPGGGVLGGRSAQGCRISVAAYTLKFGTARAKQGVVSFNSREADCEGGCFRATLEVAPYTNATCAAMSARGDLKYLEVQLGAI